MKKKLLRLYRRMQSMISHIARRLGLQRPLQLYKYENDGKFDYSSYKATQVEGNKRKIHNVWAKEENIKFISDYLREQIKDIEFGLCHGTRRGLEQKWFKKYLRCYVLGTEISDTAAQFEDTIEWDFHNVKDSWINSVDFIYSNSFDHSYDPESCINAWADCLKKGGIAVIEHSSGHEKATALDPFGAKIQIMPYLLAKWLDGKCGIVGILDAPVMRNRQSYQQFLIIQKR